MRGDGILQTYGVPFKWIEVIAVVGRSGRLLSVKSHRDAQEPDLPLEFFACAAPQEMQPHAQALPGRQVAVLNLRDQAARVLA